jgi:hypothetical protein
MAQGTRHTVHGNTIIQRDSAVPPTHSVNFRSVGLAPCILNRYSITPLLHALQSVGMSKMSVAKEF